MIQYRLILFVFSFLFLLEPVDARINSREGLEVYTIDINNYRGRNYESVELNIKDIIRRHHTVRLRRRKLLRVELEATANNGSAGVDLVVGNQVVDSAFLRRRRRARNVILRNRDRLQERYWGLDIRGSLRIRRIVVHLKHHRHPSQERGQRSQIISLGEQKIMKGFHSFFGGDTFSTYTFNANGLRGSGVRIFCTKEKVIVRSVKLRTRDGREFQIHGADRSYREGGDPEEVFFQEERLDAIIIEATSPRIKGSRGVLGVEIFSVDAGRAHSKRR